MFRSPNKKILLPWLASVLLLGVAFANVSSCRKKGKISGSGADVKFIGMIVVTPEYIALEIGEEIEVQAVAAVSSGSDLSIDQNTLEFSWVGCSEELAIVKTSGSVASVRAISPGACQISVSSGSFETNTFIVTINEPKVIGIKIAPADTLGKLGGVVDFTALSEYSDKSSKDVTQSVTWSVEPAGTATFSSTVAGRASILTAGKSKVTAKMAEFSAEANLSVSDAVLSTIIVVSEPKPNLQGVSQQFRAIGVYDDGNSSDLTSAVEWKSSNQAVALIDNVTVKGSTLLLQSGTSEISATHKGILVKNILTVGAATLTSINSSPASLALAAGFSQQIAVTGIYSDGTILDLTSAASWSSDSPVNVEVSNSIPNRGSITGLAVGSTKIKSTILNLTTYSVVNVTAATATALDLSPGSADLPKDTNLQFVAGATFSDNSYLDVTNQSVWQTTGSSISVSNTSPTKGQVKAVHSGSSDVKATLGGLSAQATVQVSDAGIQSITLSPAAATIAPTEQRQFIALATFDDSSTADYTQLVEWTSSDTSKVIVLNSSPVKGAAVALAAGAATVTATYSGVSGSAVLTVATSAPVAINSIVVTPSSANVSASSTKQYSATAFYSNGTSQDITASSVWKSSVTSVGTIDSNGLFTGLTAGNTIISAKKTNISGTAPALVTVDQSTPPAPVDLIANPVSTSSLTFSWASGGGTTASYKYAYQLGGAAPADCNSGTTGTTVSTSVTLTGLVIGTQYSMIVCALNSDSIPDESPASSATTGTTIDSPPGAFTLSGATDDDGQSMVTWGASARATSYTLKYGTVSGTYDVAVSTSASSPAIVTGLVNGTTYYFMVTAVNSGGVLNAPSEVSATPVGGANSMTYNSGSGNFVVPGGVVSVVIEIWGAGGGGGAGKDGGSLGGSPGGGGGAYCKKTLSVSPSDTIAYVVGTGGLGATDTSNSFPGDTGGSSTATHNAVVFTAGGGTGGESFGGSTVGSGGAANNCDENRTGGGGSLKIGNLGGGGGSSAAPGSDGSTAVNTSTGATPPSGGGYGGNGGALSNENGFPGIVPGGGGGGGYKTKIGGSGADGFVKISW